jgi:DNA (cytosine-5)-methyltransferase 1
MGFDARWGVLGAADVGANHQRDRIWIFAKWNRQISHSMHNGFGWRKQQPQSLEKTTFADTRCKSERPDQGLRPESEISVWKNASVVCGEISNATEQRLERVKRQEFERNGVRPTNGGQNVSNTTSIRPSGQGESEQSVNSAENRNRKAGQSINVRKSSFWAVEPDVGRVANGVAARVDRLKAIGNGQVSEVARRAWEILGDKR